MEKSKQMSTVKIVGLLSLIVVAFYLVIVGLFFAWKATLISQQEAEKVCQEFFDQVKSDIVSVPGYKVVNSGKSCTPSKDEAGFTDYYFGAIFRVEKNGNDSIDGVKANINNLAAKYPNKDYPVWIDNISTKEGNPIAICVNASKQIQENGDVYQSMPPDHYPRYVDPIQEKDYISSCSGL